MIHKYPYKTQEQFLALRKKLQGEGTKDFRLGASQVPTLYSSKEKHGLNEWTSPTVFFHEAVGFHKVKLNPTVDMLRGTLLEPVIYTKYWRYIDPENPTEEAFIENVYGKKKVYRRAKKANAIFVNDKYPWLAVSPDYLMEDGSPLEMKSLTWRTCEKYEAGIPTSIVIQLYTQMLVLEKDKGEILDVQDATHPKLYPFEKNAKITKAIIKQSRDFAERVVQGKEIMKKYKSESEQIQLLGRIAPPDDGSPYWTDFLKDKHNPEKAKATIAGKTAQLKIVLNYLRLKEEAKKEHKNILKLENKIRSWFTRGIGVIDFGEPGKISWHDKLSIPTSILTR